MGKCRRKNIKKNTRRRNRKLREVIKEVNVTSFLGEVAIEINIFWSKKRIGALSPS